MLTGGPGIDYMTKNLTREEQLTEYLFLYQLNPIRS